MIVDRMELYVVAVPCIDALKKYYPGSTGTHPNSPDAVVRLWTKDGTYGLGQQEIYGTDTSFLREQFESVRGRDPLDLDPEAYAPALMRALYDLQGKALGWPVYRLLGRKVRDLVPIAYWTAGDASPEDTAAEALVAVEKGFKTYKWHARPGTTLARVRAVHEAVGDKLGLRIDRTLSRSFSETVQIARKLTGYNIEVLEDPLPQRDPHSPEEYRLLRTKIDIPVAWHTGSIEEIFLAAKTDAIDYLCTGGSPSMLQRISAITETAGIPMWLQTIGVGGGGIGAAFEAHVGAVIRNATLPADNLHFLREDDLVKPHFEVKDGFIKVPEKPGIGVELNMDAVKRYQIA
ncbi:MAG: enolase C-terminal domain-like protein [Candidatus Bathyarchaeia archaeon]